MRLLHLSCAMACGLVLAGRAGAAPKGVPAKYRPAVKKGLAWLVKQQHKDGHWTANRGQFPVPLTALAGMALLAEVGRVPALARGAALRQQGHPGQGG